MKRRRSSSEPPSPTSGPSPASRMFNLVCSTVHDIFPMSFCPVPLELRVDTASNPRPDYPFPFTGRVMHEERNRVRMTLERDWTEEYLRQLNPTVGSVARTLQWRARGRYSAGWRRSRFSGEWLYFGPAPDPTRVADETEVVGRQRMEAAAMVDREVDRREDARWAEARAANFAQESALRVEREQRRALLRANRLVREANKYGRHAVPPPPQLDRPTDERINDETDRQVGQSGMMAGQGGQVGMVGLQMVGAAAAGPPSERPASRARSRASRPARRGGRPTALRRQVATEGATDDKWLTVMAQKAAHPEIYGWKHRNRVMEIVLIHSHPERDHIRRCLDSEETRAQEDAMALMRTQQLTGALTSLDTSWPPKVGVRIIMEGAGWHPTGEVERREPTSSSDETEEDRRWSPPPPYCEANGIRPRPRRDDEDRPGGAGRPVRA